MKLDPKFLEQTNLALSIHADVDKDYPNLKHSNLRMYIQAIADRQFDRGMDSSVVIIPDIHENRKDEVENILKTLQFRKTTQVEILFRDGHQLAAVYQPKKTSNAA